VKALPGYRVLEVGGTAMFKQAAPAATELVWTEHHAHVEGVGATTPFTLRRLPALRRALDRGDFDLIVGHAPRRPPWSVRRAAGLLRYHGRRGPELYLRSLGTLLLYRSTRTPLVVVDLADEATLWRHNFPLLDRARVYFKRELPIDRSKVFGGSGSRKLGFPAPRRSVRFQAWCGKLAPISLGVSPLRRAAIVRATTPSPDKAVDVFFAGRVDTAPTLREAGLAELRALRREGFRIDLPPEPLERPEFYRRCARAWITWSPEGLGWDCFRHYEAGLCGSVPLMSEPTILRHAPYRTGEQALLHEVEPGELARSVRAGLEDRPRLGWMGAAARDHVLRHHTLERLCEHVVATGLAASVAPD
jgi:hypothetical protein